MFTLMVSLMALASSPIQPTGRSVCGLRDLSQCADTNDLVWDVGFKRAMAAFAGRPRTDFLGSGRKGPLSDELIEAIGGAPDKPQRLSDEAYMFTACRSGDCDQKGAVILSARGDVLAAALITSDSVDDGKSPPAYRQSLDIFVRDRRLHQTWQKAIGRWSGEVAGDWRASMRRMKWRAEGLNIRRWLITSAGTLRRLG